MKGFIKLDDHDAVELERYLSECSITIAGFMGAIGISEHNRALKARCDGSLFVLINGGKTYDGHDLKEAIAAYNMEEQ